jgi:hypothetical protein
VSSQPIAIRMVSAPSILSPYTGSAKCWKG